jgi:hypothetical protein
MASRFYNSAYTHIVLLGGPHDGQCIAALGLTRPPQGVRWQGYRFSFEEGGRLYYIHESEVTAEYPEHPARR